MAAVAALFVTAFCELPAQKKSQIDVREAVMEGSVSLSAENAVFVLVSEEGMGNCRVYGFSTKAAADAAKHKFVSTRIMFDCRKAPFEEIEAKGFAHPNQTIRAAFGKYLMDTYK